MGWVHLAAAMPEHCLTGPRHANCWPQVVMTICWQLIDTVNISIASIGDGIQVRMHSNHPA
jgi:hypothetical protein